MIVLYDCDWCCDTESYCVTICDNDYDIMLTLILDSKIKVNRK